MGTAFVSSYMENCLQENTDIKISTQEFMALWGKV